MAGMAGAEPTVEGHYTGAGLGEPILDALRHAGKEIDALTVDDLAVNPASIVINGCSGGGDLALEIAAHWPTLRSALTR